MVLVAGDAVLSSYALGFWSFGVCVTVVCSVGARGTSSEARANGDTLTTCTCVFLFQVGMHMMFRDHAHTACAWNHRNACKHTGAVLPPPVGRGADGGMMMSACAEGCCNPLRERL